MAKKILIAGASGLVGSRLTGILLQEGWEVVHLGRSKKTGKVSSRVWNVVDGKMDHAALSGVDCVINLAGAGIADKRWSSARKKEILDSRIQSTKLLHDELKKGDHQVRSFVSASAIGYYGLVTEDRVVTETEPPGKDFLAQVVVQWEAQAETIKTLGIRVVELRTGIVLSKKGGVLKSITTPIEWGVGAPLGDGRQYLSWIHIDDLCRMFLKASEDDGMHGPYNAVANQPVTNAELTKAISMILKKPLWLPSIPAFLLKTVLGEMAALVIYGGKISSEKIERAGFQFMFPDLEIALRNIFKPDGDSVRLPILP